MPSAHAGAPSAAHAAEPPLAPEAEVRPPLALRARLPHQCRPSRTGMSCRSAQLLVQLRACPATSLLPADNLLSRISKYRSKEDTRRIERLLPTSRATITPDQNTSEKQKKQDTIRVKPPSLCGHSGEGVKLSNRRLDSQSSFGFAEASFWKIISCIRVPNAVLELLLVGPRYGWTWVQDRESKPRPDRNQRRSLECVWDTTFLRSCETLDRLV